MDLGEQSIGELLIRKDESAFEQVFKTHFKRLHAYAFTLLKSDADAEEAVQQVFLKLWERAENLSLSGSVTAYLYRAVHNESLNILKHFKVKANHRLHLAHTMEKQSDHGMMNKELEQQYREAMNELPEQCRTVFQLSRFADMKYREIADHLNISVKTVENHMGKALRLLRTKLVDFLSLLLLFLNF